MNSEQLRQLNKMWWRKLEPLISTFRANCQAHWIPGSNVSVDEMMIKFYGRLKHTLKMKNKPIKQGFKIWALCEGGYLYSFLFYSRLWKTGELKQHELLTNTGAVVYQLALTLPTLQDGQTYTIYLDNLFTSTPLFRELKIVGIGACGTTRVNNSVDFPAVLQIMKEKYGHQLPWGTLVAVPVDGVLCLGWIDNNTVLSLSTVHTVNQVTDVIKRWRKRPAATSSNATIARIPFDGHVRAELEVPRYINDYNYNIGGVDIADQHRQAFKTQRKAIKNWYPSWYWMLDHACINAFKIGVHAPGKHWTKRQHKDFRQLLYQELFAFAWKAEVNRQTTMLGTKRLDPTIYHSYIKLYEKRRACAWYSFQKTLSTSRSRTPSPRKRADQTSFGCVGCRVALCGVEGKDCWKRWHTHGADQ